MSPPFVRIVGLHNAGKTSLVRQLLVQLHAQDLRVAVIKHTHHPEAIAPPRDTDTGHHWFSGAAQSILVGPDGCTSIVRGNDLNLVEAIALVDSRVDLILVEGYKRAEGPVIVVGDLADDLVGTCRPDDRLRLHPPDGRPSDAQLESALQLCLRLVNQHAR